MLLNAHVAKRTLLSTINIVVHRHQHICLRTITVVIVYYYHLSRQLVRPVPCPDHYHMGGFHSVSTFGRPRPASASASASRNTCDLRRINGKKVF
jgi:hypothetical protein